MVQCLKGHEIVISSLDPAKSTRLDDLKLYNPKLLLGNCNNQKVLGTYL